MLRNPNALPAYLEAREAWAFGYGPEPRTQDCARFFAGGVEAVTGINPLGRFTSEWTTRRGARRVLARHGGMANAVSEVMTEIPVTLAQRGDGGLTDDSTLVLVEGDTVVGLHPERGQVRLPRSAMIRAWTI
ncbi:hypothetical protein [Brevundimonas sp.]|uniref:DUF6950 family protein n=1 Tax=Brevundimonas sp. TaxID=1871086 RepID=UPI001A3304EA|nr:hypothetical protein [Brevundimonas sp.]MBJ7485970.1 hypothetical protein [Brevundimonas sp.]